MFLFPMMHAIIMYLLFPIIVYGNGQQVAPPVLFLDPDLKIPLDEDCITDLLSYLDKETYIDFSLRLDRCNHTSKIPNEELCLQPWCTTINAMIDMPTCYKYTCSPDNFFPDIYGVAGMKYGPGTMHPCGRTWAESMLDRCDSVNPNQKYPGCAIFGPGTNNWGSFNPGETALLTTFGWEASTWDIREPVDDGQTNLLEEEYPEIEKTCWGDLEGGTVQSLTNLGYSPEGWHSCGYMAKRFRSKCEHPSNYPRENGTCVSWREHAEKILWGKEDESFGGNRTDYLSLSETQTGNFTKLGFSNKTAWDNGEFPSSFLLRKVLWADLSDEERDAAISSGWNLFSWDGCPNMDCIDMLHYVEQSTMPVVAKRKWNTFSVGYQKLLEVVGWTQGLWDTGKMSLLLLKPWDSQEPEVQAAAKLLGHTKDTWERCPNSNCIKRFKYMEKRWWPGGVPKDWGTFPLERKNDWTTLGYTIQIWRDKGKPKLYYTAWDSLTPAEKQAARNLGYDMSVWDGCSNPQRREELEEEAIDNRDPFRLVQAKMNIPVDFASVFEKNTGKVKPSFLIAFELAVARAMFCNNMHEKEYDGQPCYDRDSYERQRDRLFLVRVESEPVEVIFRIAANRTEEELSSLGAFNYLRLALEEPNSPIRTDPNFGEFSRVAKVEELEFSQVLFEYEREQLTFENVREAITKEEGCVENDDGELVCPEEDGAPPRMSTSLLALFFSTV